LFEDEENGYNIEEETISENTKYKIKLGTPKSEPAFPVSNPTDNEPIDDESFDDMPMDDTPEPSDDAPFDKTPFDAGVEADEDEDPKKFLEQLAGKMGTELRKYSKKLGNPDFDLEKYIINSVISATHTAEMDEEDRKDIINKINDSGDDEDNQEKDLSSEEIPDDNDSSEEMPDEDSEPKDEMSENDKYFEPDSRFAYDETKSVWEANDLLGEENLDLDSLSNSNEMHVEDEHEGNPTRYMFFSNLEQMRRQAGLLLDLDEGQIEAILNSGHDWAADHIATAKESIDQVFDFLMNETKSGDMWKSTDIEDHEDDYDYSEWSKPMELQNDIQISEGLKYHLDNKIALGESVYRYGSDKFFSLLKEVKSLYNQGLIKLNENDEFIVNDIDSKVRVNGELFQLGYIMESEEFEDKILNEGKLESVLNDAKIKLMWYGYQTTDDMTTQGVIDKLRLLSKQRNGKKELDDLANQLEILSKGTLTEAEYKGKKVELNKPKRGGSKKFYVYVKNPKTGKVKKVSFGAKSGGGNLAVKLKDPKARKAFADRHNCSKKNDKTTAGYWSCRLPRYSRLLNLSGSGKWW